MPQTSPENAMATEARPVGPDTWPDVVGVMGDNGAFSGCWCLFWRLTNQMLQQRTADDNRAALQELVTGAEPVGVLAYRAGKPVGWCQVAPRAQFVRLFRTRGLDLGSHDDPAVWSIVCLLVSRPARGTGVRDALVKGAVDHAAAHGATVVEAYPVIGGSAVKKAVLSSGTPGLFERAGFTLVATSDGRRAVMRRIVAGP